MKTAVSILQEMMVKLSEMPEYECIAQSGPQHQALFEYRCEALGAIVTATARSKKEAKQEAACLMLKKLAKLGHPVPPPYGLGVLIDCNSQVPTSLPTMDTRSYVALLKELCEEYRLGVVTYELVGDTGPPHLRHFTMRASLGMHERIATATTKKTARQLAAEQLYKYLRENLVRVTRDFVEEDALVRAREKAMERYVEERTEDAARKPDLGQKISAYHLGLASRLDYETRLLAKEALEACRDLPAERALSAVSAALKLTMEYSALECEADDTLELVELTSCAPPLTFGGVTCADAANAALDYIRIALRQCSPEPDADFAESYSDRQRKPSGI